MTKRKTYSLPKFQLAIDDRTSGLSDAALTCRADGHQWVCRAIGIPRFQQLLRQGLHEKSKGCANGCGSTWNIIFDIRSGHVLETNRNYPKNGEYLLPKLSGRLSRDAARVAQFAREFPAYA